MTIDQTQNSSSDSSAFLAKCSARFVISYVAARGCQSGQLFNQISGAQQQPTALLHLNVCFSQLGSSVIKT